MTDIIDFGDNCLPHILIRDILFLKQKTLFTLGIYGFNDILNYLKDETYEDIYKKEYLTYNGAPIADFHSKYQFYTQSPKIINTKYNFGFMHHFNLDVSTNCINNYDYVVGQFNTKIAEFKNYLASDKRKIFVNCSFYNSIETIKIDEMIETLNKLTQSKYYIFIYFYGYERKSNRIEEFYEDYCAEKFYKYDNVKIIFLKSDFSNWWEQDEKVKSILYGEMCEGFLKACADLKITIYK